MSEIFLTSRDAIDLLTEAQNKAKHECNIANVFAEQACAYLVNRISHAMGHIAHSCIKEESK